MTTEALSEWELKLREIDAEEANVFVNETRTEELLATAEIEEERSSPALYKATEAADKAALEQTRSAYMHQEPVIVEPVPALIPRLDGGFDQTNVREMGDGIDETERSQADLAETTAWKDLYGWSEFDLNDLVFEWFPAGGCTLRAAIEESNALAGKQSVLIDSAKGPFALTEGQIDITDSIDLIGYGSRAVVEASAGARIFYISGDHIMNLRSLEPGRRRRGVAIGQPIRLPGPRQPRPTPPRRDRL